MRVLATAGHVDHGKSTLVRLLTGSEPDRLDEERRRGLTIELGYAWTTLPRSGPVALVDVPGHERFVPTMLAGVGPVPAVVFVVAADDPWMPQAQEHLDVLNALDVSHCLLVVTRCDLADPAPAMAAALEAFRGTSLEGAATVPVSGRSGAGIEALRDALDQLAADLPEPDPGSTVRLWVDRVFTLAGAGTVVTGTLPAGTIRVGDVLSDGDREVRVRGLQALGGEVEEQAGAARVALRLGGRQAGVRQIARGSALVSPGRYLFTDTVDARLDSADRMPAELTLHVGSAAVRCRVRPMSGSGLARLTLVSSLPLRVGDRCLLRDPGTRQVTGCVVVDPAPPALRRRGAAARRARALAGADGQADVRAEVRRRGIVTLDLLQRIGVAPEPVEGVVRLGRFLVDDDHLAELRKRLAELMAEHHAARPLEPGPAISEAAARLGVPETVLTDGIATPPMRVADGRVVDSDAATLPADVRTAVELLLDDLRDTPFMAPTAERLEVLGLTRNALAAAERAGVLLRIDDRVVLPAGADDAAAAVLAGVPQPFTVSEARQALASSRRVVVPLLERLDRRGLTRRSPDDRRTVAALP